jgi:hypothetical protein
MVDRTVPPQTRDRAAALQHHRDAATAVLATAAGVPPEQWSRPVAAGKWSPAEITEHLRLTTAALRQEIESGGGMRIRTSWPRRLLLRAIFLGRILSTGRFPAGAKAVREIQPRGGPFDQTETIRGLDAELRRFEAALAEHPRARMTHPIFGVASASTGLRFCVVHLLHHREQIERRER